ncbi:MAG: succinylglutamate desuccinylase/aspartoacylase family protein [Fodinibius sp.]|nr:succinylglutamate desuccinylase/aspartoacylase family protein [Fodinibius sp.]
MKSKAPEATHETEYFRKTTWVRAKYAGLFQPKVKLGDKVEKKQVLGYITDPYGNERFKATASQGGPVIRS